jgi:hypothetical protein
VASPPSRFHQATEEKTIQNVSKLTWQKVTAKNGTTRISGRPRDVSIMLSATLPNRSHRTKWTNTNHPIRR